MKRRPGYFDPAVTRAAAEAIADDIVVETANDARDATVAALVQAMDTDDEVDDIVWNLVTAGWPVDERARTALTRAPHERALAHRYAVDRWVTEESVAPTLAIGERVNGLSGPRRVPVSGTIIRIDGRRARYVVASDEGGEVLVEFEATWRRGASGLFDNPPQVLF